MKTILIRVTVVAAVVIACIAILSTWRRPPIPPCGGAPHVPCIAPTIPSDDTARVREATRFDSLANVYTASIREKRDNLAKLRDSLAARPSPSPEEREKLRSVTQRFTHLDEGIDEYERQVAEYRERPQPSGDVRVPPLPPTPAPSEPPPAQGAEAPVEASGEQQAENDAAAREFDAWLKVAVAGICVAQPPLCVVAGAIAQIANLLPPGAKEQLLQVMQSVAEGRGIPREVIETARRLMRDHPELADGLGDLIRTGQQQPNSVPEDQWRQIREAVTEGAAEGQAFLETLERMRAEFDGTRESCARVLTAGGIPDPQVHPSREYATRLRERLREGDDQVLWDTCLKRLRLPEF